MTKQDKIERKNKIIKGLKKSYDKMIEVKRKNNGEIAIMKGDKIVKIKP